jgi:hypothetical protein
MATGRSQLLVQYCIILNHLSILGNKEEGIQEVIVLVWKIMENIGFILDILSALTTTQKAVVKWEDTLKKEFVYLGDCKKYNELDVITRKCKSTDFFCVIPQTKRGMPPPGKMKNMFYSKENSSKLCAKGAI